MVSLSFGFGVNSNGRYAASGILRERFIPRFVICFRCFSCVFRELLLMFPHLLDRLLEAEDADVTTDDNANLDPHKCWDIIMSGEKPGGHGERSVACGVLDMVRH